MTTITTSITSDALPEGPRWEQDKACWRAVPCEPHPVTGKDWRWMPLNMIALSKGEPTSEMTDFYPIDPATLLKNFDGTKVDLTDPSMRKFVGNAIAIRVYAALGYDNPVNHGEIHATVMRVLTDLSTAQMKIS